MNMRQLILRTETPADYRQVEELTREAFWNHYGPGCSEHYLTHILRGSDCFVSNLDLVAELDTELVGNVMYTRAKVACDDGQEIPVLCLGPLSVLPKFQGQGVGTKLLIQSRDLARQMGYRAIFLYGDPAYYGRVGFVPAKTYGIGTADNHYTVPLQAYELIEGTLTGHTGRFVEDSIFELDEQKVKEFDQGFPLRETVTGLPSQQRFAELIALREPR